jgi:hypothetical protein
LLTVEYKRLSRFGVTGTSQKSRKYVPKRYSEVTAQTSPLVNSLAKLAIRGV